MRRKVVIVGILCLQLVLVGLFAASTAAGALSGLPWHGQLPNDSTLGQVSDPAYPVHPVIWRSYEAFSDFYGPLWYEKHVHPDSRFVVNKMYDALLAGVSRWRTRPPGQRHLRRGDEALPEEAVH